MYVAHADGLGALGIDILGDLNSVIQWAKDTTENALPTWAGGNPLTPDQLQAIQTQAKQNIHVAAAGNTQLEAQAVAQMMSETTAVANQARAAAAASDTSIPNPLDLTSSFNLASWLLWGGLAVLGVVLVVELVD